MAALGRTLEIEALDGPAEVRIPAGTQSGEMFVVSERGLPHVRHARRGDLQVRVRVQVPTHLSPEQREMLTAYAAAGGEDVHPEDRTLFDRIRDVFKTH